jgi:hypothetical protein
MVIDAAASSRERGHLARFGACGGESAPQGRVALPGAIGKMQLHPRSFTLQRDEKLTKTTLLPSL